MGRVVAIIGIIPIGDKEEQIRIEISNDEDPNSKKSKFTKKNCLTLQEDFLNTFVGKGVKYFKVHYIVSGTELNNWENHSQVIDYCTINDDNYIEMIKHFVKCSNSQT